MKNIKLRYYLRGLGIGVLVTAFIMTVAGGDESPLTDAQIKERAAQLGMVDESTLVLADLRTDEMADEPSGEADSQPEAEHVQDVENTENADAEQEAVDTENADAEQEAVDTENTDTEPDMESTENEDVEQESAVDSNADEEESETTEDSYVTGDTVTLTIRAGANSYSVSKELQNMGLIADAGAFDDYLCDNGYAKIVRVGTYEIVKGTSEEEIAKIITGKR